MSQREYRKGSKPTGIIQESEIAVIKNLLITIPEKSIKDYKNGIFAQYSPYMTSFNINLTSIEDGIKFNNYHEGLHVGTIMALRKLV